MSLGWWLARVTKCYVYIRKIVNGSTLRSGLVLPGDENYVNAFAPACVYHHFRYDLSRKLL